MRILLITSKLNFETSGGSVFDLHLKAIGLQDLGHQVEVVTAWSSFNKMGNPPVSLPYKHHCEEVGTARLIGMQQGIYRILKKYEKTFDVAYIDAHMFLYGGGLYRWLGGTMPVVGFFNQKLNCWGDSVNNETLKQTPLARLKRRGRLLIEKYLGMSMAARLDAFIFNTPQVGKLYIDFGIFKGWSPEKIKAKSFILEDFLDTVAIIKEEKITPASIRAHQTAAPITIFSAGRMIKEKGFDLIIRAFELLPDRERYRVVLCGGGPDYDRLVALVKEKKLEQYITFPGWVKKEEVPQFFRQGHIFVYPKWWIEYGAIVLMEAMSFGLPSIVPAGGALQWLLGDGGLTFLTDDVASLAQRLEALGADAKARVRYGEQALQRARAFDYRQLTLSLEKIFQSTQT